MLINFVGHGESVVEVRGALSGTDLVNGNGEVRELGEDYVARFQCSQLPAVFTVGDALAVVALRHDQNWLFALSVPGEGLGLPDWAITTSWSRRAGYRSAELLMDVPDPLSHVSHVA